MVRCITKMLVVMVLVPGKKYPETGGVNFV